MFPTLRPSWQQHLAWLNLQDNITEEILFGGGAGGGKSWLGCEWLLHHCLTYKGSRYYVGRDELKKLRQSTVVTMYKVLNHYNMKPEHYLRFNAQDSAFKFRNGSQIDLLELKYVPSDPMYERFGSLEYTSGWIEEAGEVEEDAAAMIGSRSSRHLNDKYDLTGKTLITCNPKKNWLYYNFYLPWKERRLPAEKAFIRSLAKDNNHGESGYIKKLSRFTGAMGARLRDGNWEYDNDPACLIETNAIGKCFENFIWDLDDLTTRYYITVDVARFGRDFTVIGIWKGWSCKLYKYKHYDTVMVAAEIKEFMKLYRIPVSRVVVDADGIGGGVVDQLRCMSFINGARPAPSPVNPARTMDGEELPENYTNMKAQCCYRMAEKINMGVVKLKVEKTPAGSSEDHEKGMIREEMEQVKRDKLDGDGKMGVVKREDVVKMIGRSPDYWSSIMMRYYFELHKHEIWAA
jgi:phage terminase large subunit